MRRGWTNSWPCRLRRPISTGCCRSRADNEANKGNSINAPLEATLWRKFISAPDQIRTRTAFALSEIFVVGVSAITANWPLFGAASFMDTLAEHGLGDFRTLLGAVTLSLSMGCMLTYRGNRKEDPRTGREPDENYAREVAAAVHHRPVRVEP